MRLFKRRPRLQPVSPSQSAPPSGGSRAITLLVVVPGELTPEGSLSLQGTIQAGMVATALADERVAAFLASESEPCRAMLRPLAERRETIPTRPLPAGEDDPAGLIRSFLTDYPGRTLVVILEDDLLRGILSVLDGVEKQDHAPPPVSPASITRLRIRPDLSYSARFDDTEHLDLPMGSVGGFDV